jgi:PQ loop repeat
MMFSDVAYDLFTIFNWLRIVAYLPQIYKIARDTNGASSISYSTWLLWTAANGSTAVYSFSRDVTSPNNFTGARRLD